MIQKFEEIRKTKINITKLFIYDCLCNFDEYIKLNNDEKEKIIDTLYFTWVEVDSIELTQIIDISSNYFDEIINDNNFDLCDTCLNFI